MIRAVLDVNVLISALIAPLGLPHQLWQAWRADRFTLISSEHIIRETVVKLRSARIARRYQLPTDTVPLFEALMRSRSTIVPVDADDIRVATGDPEDDTVLATVRLGRASYLVTGDGGLLALGTYAGAQIVTPRQFTERLVSAW